MKKIIKTKDYIITEKEMLEYIEKNYKKYHSCSKVADLNDLMCIVDCDIQEGARAEILLEEIEKEVKDSNPNLEGGYLTLEVYNVVCEKYRKLLEELYIQSKLN